MRLIAAGLCAGMVLLTPFFITQRSGRPTVDAVSHASFVRVPGQVAGGAVLDVGAPGGWMSQAVGAPAVMRVGNRYRMWFTGVRTTAPGESPYLFRSEIGSAVSDDGLSWTLENDGRPTVGPGPEGAFDAFSTGQPIVLRDGRRYLMWYGGADGTQAADSVRIERIGIAESRDGVTWTRLNGGRAVIDTGAAGAADSTQATGPYVIRAGDEYLMWYGAFNGRHTIAAARSRDGIRWKKEAVTGLGAEEALGPSVYMQAGEFLMFYSVMRDRRWMMVAARSRDGFAWRRINDGRSVLGEPPRGSFDAAGDGQNHSVHPSDVLWDGGRLRVWYMAEAPTAPFPQRIGLMEARFTQADEVR